MSSCFDDFKVKIIVLRFDAFFVLKKIKNVQIKHKVQGFAEVDNEDTEPVYKNQFQGQRVGVFTSGGDSAGMNSAVESIVRMGAFLGIDIYLIHEGFSLNKCFIISTF
jgi:hypothetical protein